jgi:hypothetical protein
MEREAFIDSLKADGFAEPVLVERAPDTGLDEPHAESYGPQGVRYLSGRR